jgi:hypothetical protein
MKIDSNLVLPLNPNGLQQSTLHQSTLRKLQTGLRQPNAAGTDPYGARKIVWNEAEQLMNKDGFAKLALEKDATLSGITAEFSAWAARYSMYEDATGNSEADMEREISVVSHLTEENADEYNIYKGILTNRCEYVYVWGQRPEPIDVNDMQRLFKEEPGRFYPHAEEIRATFAESMDEFIKKLREDYASGAIGEEAYKDRQSKINEAYDKFAHKYGNYGLTDYYYMKAHYETDVFSAWEASLNDIKLRYERGDFGFAKGVYEERVAAWSVAFDKWADKETANLSHNPTRLTSIALSPMFGGDPCQEETDHYWNDFKKLYTNAKAHLLAGGASRELTDDILNKDLTFAAAADRRFFFSDEFMDMDQAVDHLANTFEGRNAKTHSQYEREWGDLYEDFARRVKSDIPLGETLRNILLQYFDLAASRLPSIFRGGFLPEYGFLPE